MATRNRTGQVSFETAAVIACVCAAILLILILGRNAVASKIKGGFDQVSPDRYDYSYTGKEVESFNSNVAEVKTNGKVVTTETTNTQGVEGNWNTAAAKGRTLFDN